MAPLPVGSGGNANSGNIVALNGNAIALGGDAKGGNTPVESGNATGGNGGNASANGGDAASGIAVVKQENGGGGSDPGVEQKDNTATGGDGGTATGGNGGDANSGNFVVGNGNAIASAATPRAAIPRCGVMTRPAAMAGTPLPTVAMLRPESRL